MASEHVVDVTLRTNVTGEEQLEALKKSFAGVANAAKKASVSGKLASLGGGQGAAFQALHQKNLAGVLAASTQFGTQLRQSIVPAFKMAGASAANFARTVPQTIGKAFSGSTIFTALRGGLAKGMGVSGMGFGKGLGTLLAGEVKGIWNVLSSGVGAFVGGLKKVGSALIQASGLTTAFASALGLLGAGLGTWKLFSMSFKGAMETADEALSLAGKATYFKTDVDTVESQLAAATELFGSQAEGMAKKLEGTLEKVRMGKPLARGDKEVAARLGITQKKVLEFEKNMGRRGMIADYAANWAKTIEKDQAAIEASERLGKKGEKQTKKLKDNLRQRLIDLGKVFGQDFAEFVGIPGAAKFAADMVKVQEAAGELSSIRGFNADFIKRQAMSLKVSWAYTTRAMEELFTNRIGIRVMGPVRQMVDAFNDLTKAVGPTLADNIAKIANAGFLKITEALKAVDTEKLNKTIDSIGTAIADWITSLSVEDIGSKLMEVGRALIWVGRAAAWAWGTLSKFAGWKEPDKNPYVPDIPEGQHRGFGKGSMWERDKDTGVLTPKEPLPVSIRDWEKPPGTPTGLDKGPQYAEGGIVDAVNTVSKKLDDIGAYISGFNLMREYDKKMPKTPEEAKRQRAFDEQYETKPAGEPNTQPMQDILNDLSGMLQQSSTDLRSSGTEAGASIQTASATISTNGQAAANAISAVDLTTTASAAGTALGNAAGAALRASMAGFTIPAPGWIGQARALSSGGGGTGRDAATTSA